MPTLPEIQRAFAVSLGGGGNGHVADFVVAGDFTAAERLGIYRNSCRSVLADVLRMTYPAVDRLVGTDCFNAAAEWFCAACPPHSGYLNEYGGEFADFLAGLPEIGAALRYLPDVARFEWTLSCAANADGAASLDLNSLAKLDPGQHEHLSFLPHPSVRLLELDYPADRIADAVLADDDDAIAAIDLADGPARLVVNRGPNGVQALRLTQEAYEFACRLFAGERLGDLLNCGGPDAAALLAEHLVGGRLSGFRLASEMGAINL
ncbi:MAG: putative DNA-binding domain-containing protein [Alphaproteobacteria bacterium]